MLLWRCGSPCVFVSQGDCEILCYNQRSMRANTGLFITDVSVVVGNRLACFFRACPSDSSAPECTRKINSNDKRCDDTVSYRDVKRFRTGWDWTLHLCNFYQHTQAEENKLTLTEVSLGRKVYWLWLQPSTNTSTAGFYFLAVYWKRWKFLIFKFTLGELRAFSYSKLQYVCSKLLSDSWHKWSGKMIWSKLESQINWDKKHR